MSSLTDPEAGPKTLPERCHCCTRRGDILISGERGAPGAPREGGLEVTTLASSSPYQLHQIQRETHWLTLSLGFFPYEG